MKQVTLIIPGELPDINQIIAASKSHHMKYSSMKKEYTDLVTWIARGKGKFKRIDLDITWHCKNRRKDKDNICGGGIKFILDGLVASGMIKNDGWNEVNDFTHRFRVDKLNPRIEVAITECKQ